MRGQSFNVDALLFLRRVLSQPALTLPHISVPHIGYVDWPSFARAGIRGIVFDKDNTLTVPYSDLVYPCVGPSLRVCQNTFGNSNILLISNSVGGPDDEGYNGADIVEASLGISVFRRQSKKPEGFEEMLQWFNHDRDKDSQIQPSQLCMVGDRLLTDVVFGNIHGMVTIHVQPLTLENDNLMAKCVRTVENKFLLPLIRKIWENKSPHHPVMQQPFSFKLDKPLV